MLDDSLRLWEFDHETVTVVFNIRHPVWVALDETNGRHNARHDKQIMHLQTYIGFQVVMLLAQHYSHDEFEANREAIDQQVKPYASLFIADN